MLIPSRLALLIIPGEYPKIFQSGGRPTPNFPGGGEVPLYPLKPPLFFDKSLNKFDCFLSDFWSF